MAFASMAAAGRTVECESTYYVPETQSLYEARHTAAVRARIEALERTFGALVSMASRSTVANGGRVSFRSTGTSEVRGVWLRDISEPDQRVWWDDKLQSLAISTTVRGEVEELRQGSADLHVGVRRNCTDSRCEDNEFVDGDNLYLSFRSSAPGYLAVYLMDDESMVHTALPYSRDSRGSVPVDRSTDYIFFNPDGEDAMTDAYRLRTSRSAELCRLCVVFSPEPFAASAAESFGGTGRARSQSFDNFDRWLTRLRRDNPDTQVLFNDIILKKR